MLMRKIILLLCCLLLMSGCAAKHAPVKLGVERLAEPQVQELLAGKRLGLFTNQTGVDSQLRSSVELLRQQYDLQAVFVPEHGLYGAVAAGEKFAGHEYDGIPVFSLYQSNHRPTKEMLDAIDTMVVDIQDVGVRHYTYFSSLAYIMEECAKYHKQVVVLDRPNPLGGAVQGPVLKESFSSFIGLYSIPLRHGLTISEFARYINTEEKINCALEVVPMKHYRRSLLWQDTRLPWVLTSPLIPTAETAFLYCATGVSGDSNLSVGVGTAQPFAVMGAPFADAQEVKRALDELRLPHVAFRAAAFTPRYGAYKGELVQGVEIYLLDKRQVNLPELDYLLLTTFRRLYPDKVQFPERGYDALGYKLDIALGESSLREGEEPEQVFARWRQECAAFSKKAEPYLLYH